MIRKVGSMVINERHRSTCHCGAVELELHLPDGLTNLRRCNCSVCGIYTHHQQRSDPTKYGFNVGCLEGVNPFLLGTIQATDGVNHPSDLKT